jgi:hypothetical protein
MCRCMRPCTVSVDTVMQGAGAGGQLGCGGGECNAGIPGGGECNAGRQRSRSFFRLPHSLYSNVLQCTCPPYTSFQGNPLPALTSASSWQSRSAAWSSVAASSWAAAPASVDGGPVPGALHKALPGSTRPAPRYATRSACTMLCSAHGVTGFSAGQPAC